MKPFLTTLLLAPLLHAGDWSWQVEEGVSVELRAPHGPAARFLMNPKPADPHFDLLTGPNGKNLVWVAPPDHVWHYGQWFSWKFINGVNFWETDKKTGQSKGIAEVLPPQFMMNHEVGYISYTRQYRLAKEQDPVLEDIFTITISPPKDEHTGPLVVWRIKTTALAEVTLDRTPPPGEPGGKSWGGYCGLSWRGAKDIQDLHYTTSEGPIAADDNSGIIRAATKWVTAAGTIDGEPVAITIIDNPQNRGHPNTFYIFAKPKLPFWYINPSLVMNQPITLKPGESFDHYYHIVPHNGTFTP